MRAHMLSCKKWVADFGGAAVLRVWPRTLAALAALPLWTVRRLCPCVLFPAPLPFTAAVAALADDAIGFDIKKVRELPPFSADSRHVLLEVSLLVDDR